jgi:hypothetical protein
MYNIPLPGATQATSPIQQPNSGADIIAAMIPQLVQDINANIGGRIATLTAAATSAATTGAQAIATLPIALLSSVLAPRGTAASGAGLRLVAWGGYGATTTIKSVSLVFNATSLALGATGSTTVTGTSWWGQMDIRRSAASSQNIFGYGSSTAPAGPNASFVGTASESEAAAATFAIIGTSTAGVAADITVKGMEIFWLP